MAFSGRLPLYPVHGTPAPTGLFLGKRSNAPGPIMEFLCMNGAIKQFGGALCFMSDSVAMVGVQARNNACFTAKSCVSACFFWQRRQLLAGEGFLIEK